MDPGSSPFPASLAAEDQALFGLGHYHQSFTPRHKTANHPEETGETA